jgi:hypothetical protein
LLDEQVNGWCRAACATDLLQKVTAFKNGCHAVARIWRISLTQPWITQERPAAIQTLGCLFHSAGRTFSVDLPSLDFVIPGHWFTVIIDLL